jgi:hypothetical protein
MDQKGEDQGLRSAKDSFGFNFSATSANYSSCRPTLNFSGMFLSS